MVKSWSVRILRVYTVVSFESKCEYVPCFQSNLPWRCFIQLKAFEPYVRRHTFWHYTQRRLESPCTFAQSDQSLLSAWRNFVFLATQNAHCEGSANVQADLNLKGRTCPKVRFLTVWLICLDEQHNTIWASARQNQENDMCAQRRLISALASAQSDQSLCCPHEKSLGPKLPVECTAKTLIRLGGCPGWSESSLGAHAICWFCHAVAHLLL